MGQAKIANSQDSNPSIVAEKVGLQKPGQPFSANNSPTIQASANSFSFLMSVNQ